MGGEVGQCASGTRRERPTGTCWKYPLHEGLMRLVRDLNTLYQAPSLHQVDSRPAGFQ